MNRQGWIAIAAAVVLAAIVGGIAYNAGLHQGILQSGKMVVAAPPAGGGPYPYPYPYYGWHPWGFGFSFFPFFFFIFLWILLIRGIFWRGGWHRHYHGCGQAAQERANDSGGR